MVEDVDEPMKDALASGEMFIELLTGPGNNPWGREHQKTPKSSFTKCIPVFTF